MQAFCKKRRSFQMRSCLQISTRLQAFSGGKVFKKVFAGRKTFAGGNVFACGKMCADGKTFAFEKMCADGKTFA